GERDRARAVDRLWSASVASPSAAGRPAGDGRESQAARPRGCVTTAPGTRRRPRTRHRVRIDDRDTTLSLSIKCGFAGATGSATPVRLLRGDAVTRRGCTSYLISGIDGILHSS